MLKTSLMNTKCMHLLFTSGVLLTSASWKCEQTVDSDSGMASSLGSASRSDFVNTWCCFAEPNRGSKTFSCHSQWRYSSSIEILQGPRWCGTSFINTRHHVHLLKLCSYWQPWPHHPCYHHVFSHVLWRCKSVLPFAWASRRAQLASSLEISSLELLTCGCGSLHRWVLYLFPFFYNFGAKLS